MLNIVSIDLSLLTATQKNTIKRNAHEHERFRKVCVRFAQSLHRIDMRMRLGLLQDPAVIDRQIAKEVAEAEARRKRAQAPTVKTEAETKAEEALTAKDREAITAKAKAAHKPRIRPLTEAKAIETGANFISETFLFAVGISVIIFEQWRSRRKEKNRHEDVADKLEMLETKLGALEAELAAEKGKQTPEPNIKTEGSKTAKDQDGKASSGASPKESSEKQK